MSKFLLLARYTRDLDVPLRLFESEQEAEKEAIRLEENPECIVKEFPRVFELMFGTYVRPNDLFSVLVLRISDETGQIEASGPERVALDSTKDGVQAQQPQAAETPIPVPDGCIEITDPNHKLRPCIDFYLSRTLNEWMSITETDAFLIGDWSDPSRFCCLADKHPDLQGKSAETPTREQLQAVVRSLEQSNGDLRAEFEQWRAHADTRIGELMTENSNLIATRTQLHKTISELLEQRAQWVDGYVPELQARYDGCEQQLNVLQSQNSDLRRLNEDLNNRLSKTLARAAMATHLESGIRASGLQLLRFSVALGDRRRWATTFVEEGVLAKPYLQAIERIDEQFTELLHEFVDRFPHIQPDLPDEWQMRFDNDDDDNGNAAPADNDNE